jgi:hypothetical protein
MALSKLEILKIRELKKQLVDVPELEVGGQIWIQEMSAAARDKFDNWVVSSKNRDGMRARVLIATAVDDEGKLMFSDLDIPDLLKMPARVMSRLTDVGMELSGMNEAAKAEATKNSKADPKDALPSDSVVN